MKNSKLITGAAALVAIMAVAGVAATSFASGGNFFHRGENFSPVDHQAVEQALENKDYNAWKELMSGSPMADKITEENFNKLVQAHELMLAGDYKGAREIQKEIGFGSEMGKGQMRGRMPFGPGNNEAVKTALDNNDYNAWLEAVGKDSSMAGKINQDNFPKLVEAHKLQEQARRIMEELGLKGFGK